MIGDNFKVSRSRLCVPWFGCFSILSFVTDFQGSGVAIWQPSIMFIYFSSMVCLCMCVFCSRSESTIPSITSHYSIHFAIMSTITLFSIWNFVHHVSAWVERVAASIWFSFSSRSQSNLKQRPNKMTTYTNEWVHSAFNVG